MRHLKDLVSSFPNWVTLLRMALVPVLVLFISRKLFWAAFVFFAFLAWTDWLDGYLARKFGQETPIGKILDPLADKVLVWVTIWMFKFSRDTFYWVLMLFSVDMALVLFGGLAYWLHATGKVDERAIGANVAGKWKFGFQVAFIVSMFLVELGFSKDAISQFFILPSSALFWAIFLAWASLIGHIVSFFAVRKIVQRAA